MDLNARHPSSCDALLGAGLLTGQGPIQGVAVAPFAVSRGYKYTVYIASIGSLSSSDVVVASPSSLTAIGPSQPPTSLGVCAMGQTSGASCHLAAQAPLSLRIFWSPPGDTGSGVQDMAIIQGYTMALEAPSSVIQRRLTVAESAGGVGGGSFVQIMGLVRVCARPFALLASLPLSHPTTLSACLSPSLFSSLRPSHSYGGTPHRRWGLGGGREAGRGSNAAFTYRENPTWMHTYIRMLAYKWTPSPTIPPLTGTFVLLTTVPS